MSVESEKLYQLKDALEREQRQVNFDRRDLATALDHLESQRAYWRVRNTLACSSFQLALRVLAVALSCC